MAEGSALKAMVSFFTIWQRELTEEDMEAMNRKFHLAPIIGAFIGIFVLVISSILVAMQCKGLITGMVAAIVVLASVYIGSRFLHFDGLADFGDGSIVAGTQADHVRALKDTLIGAGGVGIALIVTLFNFSEYTMMAAYLAILAPVVEVLVKNAQVVAAAFGNPGNGMASRQVSETCVRSMQISTVISLVLILVLGAVGFYLTDWMFYMMNVWHDNLWLTDVVFTVLIGLVASVVTGYIMAKRANRVFGMVNGDILGATNEISRAVVMLCMAVTFMVVI